MMPMTQVHEGKGISRAEVLRQKMDKDSRLTNEGLKGGESAEVIMKNKWIYCAMTGILTALLLGGCGDGSESSPEEPIIDALEPITLASESESEDEPEEAPENTETPAPAGDDLLISGGTEGLSAEMESAVLEGMKNLLQNLELPEYLGEAIHLVSSEEWFASLAGGLYEGCRSYTIGGTGGATLSVQVGYDIEEKPYINVCYQADGQIIVLKQAKGVTWILQTSVSGGAYNGAFEKWQVDSGTGHILKETGTYANGITVGEYTKSEHEGDSGDAFDLWTNRDNFAYDTTTVTYDEQGEIAVTPTPAPTATPKPAATKRPVQTAAPTQAPTPEPQPSEPEPEPPAPPQDTPAPTPAPTPEPTPAPSEGDTDIDWSPDMM